MTLRLPHAFLAATAVLTSCRGPHRPTSPVGTWSATFWLDSANPLGPTPTVRVANGSLTIGDSGQDSTALWPDTLTRVPSWLGNYDVDFSPFFGSAVARDVSTSVFGPVGRWFATELTAVQDRNDSLHLTLIPRISHGGIEATGLQRGDSVIGAWYVRAYAGGATGHFRLVRTSDAPPPVRRDPPPPPPDTLPLARRGTILVRIQDVDTRHYLRMRHALHWDQTYKSSYTVGDSSDGWGPAFWLAPGRYGIVIDEIPCGDSTHFLEHKVEQPFRAVAGETTRVTVRIPIAS